jgi:ParB/RepB/Spo0J family partition protein
VSKQQYAQVPVDQIVVTDNVRRDVPHDEDMIESVRQHGILQPLVGCPSEDGTNVDLLMGQRRLAAAKAAGLTHVPMVLRGRPSQRERVLMQLTENLARADMTPIDEALAFDELVGLGLKVAAIARSVHRQHGFVEQRLRLLHLPGPLRIAVDLGYISPTAALEFPRALLGNKDVEERLAKIVRGGDASLRQWIRDELSVGTVLGHGVGGKSVRVIMVDHDVYNIVVRESKAAGVTLGQWASDTIRKAVANS